MATLYSIVDFDFHFTKNRNRELAEMSWISLPLKFDGDGYTELVDHPDGAAHYACWVTLAQLAGRCQPRGTLLRDTGQPHNSESLARITRLPAEMFDSAIVRLLSIGWLESEEVADKEVAATAHQSAPPVPATAHQSATIHNITIHNNTKTKTKTEQDSAPAKAGGVARQIDAVCEFYKTYHPRARPGGKAKRLIRARLANWTIDDLCRAIDGCHRSPFHSGENDSQTKYQSLELILRDDGQVQKFIELPEHPPPVLSKKTQRNAAAIKNFVKRSSDNGSERPKQIRNHDGDVGQHLPH